MRTYVNLLPLMLLTLSLAACNSANYEFAQVETGNGGLSDPGSGGGVGGGGSCRDQLLSLTTPTKILMVVDKSGSNSSASAGLPATDPNKSLRGNAIQNFFDQLKNKANFSWGFVAFHDYKADPYIGSLSSAFSSSPLSMQSAIDLFYYNDDIGSTPYDSALSAARQAVATDSKSDDTKYIVVFISDGMPSPEMSTSAVTNGVKSVLAEAPTQTSFNTIYYGPTNPDAADLMKSMAVAGKGRFLDTNNSNGALDLNNVVTIPGVNCP